MKRRTTSIIVGFISSGSSDAKCTLYHPYTVVTRQMGSIDSWQQSYMDEQYESGTGRPGKWEAENWVRILDSDNLTIDATYRVGTEYTNAA